MQKEEMFKKGEGFFKKTPNLQDYASLYGKFSWEEAKNEIEWFDNGGLNAAYNACDKHVKKGSGGKTALIFEGSTGEKQTFTFSDLTDNSNRMGNYLKSLGVEKGDRVFLFLPRNPWMYFSFLGILKIGAIAGTLFSAFQEQALFDRLSDSGAKVLITTTELSKRLDNIRGKLPDLKNVLLTDDAGFINAVNQASIELETVKTSPDDYAFMLYTSGTTGKPKGVVHRHYAILSQHLTAKQVLDIQEGDVYWCTADPGWVTGIAYTILGTWSNGVTSVVYEGRFDADKWYQILQDYKVNIWYTAPTAIRMLMSKGTETVKKYDMSALRHMLSVGEPLNPEAIKWGIESFGMPFHDTWWQTETGAMSIVNYPCNDIKIGSMGKPAIGMHAEIVDDAGNPVQPGTEGNIALKPPWPSMMQTVWNREEKYKSYFTNGWYISGDRGLKDNDGYFWFIGRADDVIKTSGERVGPFEVESALVEHPAVIEAGVIGKPDELRGEIIKAYVVLNQEYAQKAKDPAFAESLKTELSMEVKKHLAGHAYPREIEFIDKLPKTRSGKIMRRILKAKEMGLPVGDTSTLEEY